MHREKTAAPLRIIAVGLCLALAMVGLASCSGGSHSQASSSASAAAKLDTKAVAATWNGGQVTEEEIINYTSNYRAANEITDDSDWALFLAMSGMETEDWRDYVARIIADESLCAARAKELGITLDESLVQDQILTDKEDAGIDPFDDAAWTAYLKEAGLSAGDYRAKVETSVLQQQLLEKEVPQKANPSNEELDEYISDYFEDVITRRWSVLSYATKKEAKAALDELSPHNTAGGEELIAHFLPLIEQDSSDQTNTDNYGDIGWDVTYDMEDLIDELDEEEVEVGHLSTKVHELNGSYYVMLCTDEFDFTGKSFKNLPDDQLKDYVRSSLVYDAWQEAADEYFEQLEESGNVKVTDMPAGLPYNVDDEIEKLFEEDDEDYDDEEYDEEDEDIDFEIIDDDEEVDEDIEIVEDDEDEDSSDSAQ